MSIQQPNPTLYIKNIDWKIKKGLLRRALYSLFTRHGKVLEIITLRKDGLRGQAFVIMADVQCATAALQAEQGLTFFGKDLVIEFARNKSDRIAKRDGDPPRRAKKKMKEAAKDAVQPQVSEDAPVAGDESAPPPMEPTIPSAPPSKLLLAQNLPAECNEMALAMLFQQYKGYVEVRVPRPGLAFIEFTDEPSATLALQGLNGFKLTPNDTLQLGYGK